MEKINLWDDFPVRYEDGSDIPQIKYFAPKGKPTGAAIITFAGGGYRMRALYECESYCELLSGLGIAMFDVEYRVKPSRFPTPLIDARRAVMYVRENAKKYGLDPNKIAVMGSSAGGHLAALVSTYLKPIDGEYIDGLGKSDFLPNAQILCYPVMDFESNPGSYLNLLSDNPSDDQKNNVTPYNLATKGTPPAFIWHTSTDPAVNVSGSLKYAQKLHEEGVPIELHIYPVGGHGLGLGYYPEMNIDVPYIQSWVDNLTAWLKLIQFI